MHSIRFWLAFLLCLPVAAQADPNGLPYRFLLVISDQWKDPASHIIEGRGEFPTIAGLLKSWGLPFEILRLDQQRFDAYHVLDREGASRYGTVIWDVNPDRAENAENIDAHLLESLVKDQGVALVVLGDSVAFEKASALAGVRYISEYKSPDGVALTRDHFITRGLRGREPEFLVGAGWGVPGSRVAAEGAAVLAARGALPFLTVRESQGAGRVLWLGVDRATQMGKQFVRDLLKRCLVWAQGYALYAEYPKSIVLFMDDMGTSDKTYLSYWHYRTPSEEIVRSGLIEPLKRHKAVLVQNVVTGYVDRKTRRVLEPWRQRVVDELDGKTVHDYASTKRGLEAGVREGVLEIQSHGWTHMLPDLDSPPGPWWNAPLDGTASLDWYNEFGDRLRKREIPAATQRFHLERALEYIRKDFGVTPLFLNPGGGEYSRSFANSTARVAAQLGFGLTREDPVYLSRDLIIELESVVPPHRSWAHDRKLPVADISWTIDGPTFLIFHDRDLSLDHSSVERLLSSLGEGVRYMTAGEYCAYLHAQAERDASSSQALSLSVVYDDHYCRYFETHQSTWTLHLSDETRQALKTAVPERQTIEIPKGLGRHAVFAYPLRAR